jgi:cytochrome c oxidase subunit 1
MSLTQTPAAGVPSASGDEKARRMAVLWLVTGGTLLVVLALLGLLLRLTQALGVLPDQWFYAVLTLHGTGMVAVALMSLAVVLRYLVADQLPIVHKVNVINYVLTVVAAALVLIATLIGHFGTGWTFLYPLPDHPGPVPGWSANWAYLFLVAVALVAVAFALWSLEILYAGVRRFGNPGRMFGADILTGRSKPGDPNTTSPSIIAAGVMAIGGIMTVIPGAIVIVLMIINNIDRNFVFNALVAKELIFFAGHMLVNFDIYLGAGIAYAVLPHYVKRPWKASKVVVFAWWLTAVLIILPYFHHLYMDFAQPAGLAILGNIGSYASGIPTAVVTVFSGVLLVYRSGMTWRPAPMFIFAAFAGWIIGGTGALIDSTPAVNEYFHNTLWVPAHFHTYMALGAVMFLLGGVYHATPELTGQELSDRIGTVAARCILIGGWIVVLAFFASGAMSIPRRYAFVQVPIFQQMATVGLIGAIIVAIGALLILGDLFRVYLPGIALRPAPAYTSSPATAEGSGAGA